MRILLVRPARLKQAITLGEFMFSEPIGLEIIHRLLSPEHEVEILDLMIDPPETFEQKMRAWKPQVVGFTTLCVDVPASLRLARQAKQIDPDVITMVGGTQAFLAPESFYQPEMDHVLQYTNRDNLIQLIRLIAAGEPVPILDGIRSRHLEYKYSGVKGRNECLKPDRSSTARYRQHYNYFGYKPAAIMQTSLGCSKGCHFCLRWRIEGGRETDLPMDEVMDEIQAIQEPTIMIYDNDFLHDGERLEEFCDALDARGIEKNFICYGSVYGIIQNQQAVARFAKHGLKAVLVGYESFKDEELSTYHKASRVNDNLLASRLLKEMQVDCWASFIFHPDWSKADFKDFRRYMRRLQPEICTFSPLTPFPNLPLYKEYQDRLLVKKENYHQWSFGQMVVRPSKLSIRGYLYQMLLSSLYINYVNNNITYLIRKFSLGTVFRIVTGSSRVAFIMLKMIIKGEAHYEAIREDA